MSDNVFSRESSVANRLRAYLLKNHYRIVQLVTPGGQCPISLSYTVDGRKKTCFPDLICFSPDKILIGEIKANFSLRDKIKLLQIKNSPDGTQNLLNLICRRFKECSETKPVLYLLIHEEASAAPDDSLVQLIVLPDTVLWSPSSISK